MTRFREFGGQLSDQSEEPDKKWLQIIHSSWVSVGRMDRQKNQSH